MQLSEEGFRFRFRQEEEDNQARFWSGVLTSTSITPCRLSPWIAAVGGRSSPSQYPWKLVRSIAKDSLNQAAWVVTSAGSQPRADLQPALTIGPGECDTCSG